VSEASVPAEAVVGIVVREFFIFAVKGDFEVIARAGGVDFGSVGSGRIMMPPPRISALLPSRPGGGPKMPLSPS
jgi:hypothetical protein